MIGNNICKKYIRYHHFRSLPAIFDIRQKNKDEPEVVIYYNPEGVPGLYKQLREHGRIQEFAWGSLPLPSSLPFPLPFPCPSPFSLEVGPLKTARGYGERCMLPSGSRRSPGRKRIWCTLKLPESHWWQSP